MCEWACGPRHLLLLLQTLWGCTEEKLVAGIPSELLGTDYYTDYPTFLRARVQTPRELLDDHCPDTYDTFEVRMGQK